MCPGDMGRCDGEIVSREVVSGGIVCDKAMKLTCSNGHVQLCEIFEDQDNEGECNDFGSE